MATMLGLATGLQVMFAIVTADGTGTTSAGSCYNMTTHAVSCNMAELDCSSPHMWYSPGYVSPRSGCCHCEASCANTSGNCTYYDALEDPQENWGCYEHAARQCDCLVSEAGCTAKGAGHTWTSGCNSCASQGSCYDMTSHVISCDVPETSCSSPNMWYAPGYVSPRSGCCHCRASCKEPTDNCTYNDAEVETQRNWGCYDSSTNACECDTTEAECVGSWTQSCRSCNGEVSTSSAGRPRGFVLALLVLLYGFFAAEANTGSGTGCYLTDTQVQQKLFLSHAITRLGTQGWLFIAPLVLLRFTLGCLIGPACWGLVDNVRFCTDCARAWGVGRPGQPSICRRSRCGCSGLCNPRIHNGVASGAAE